LPFSSTVGLESAFIGKPVIIATKCYYEKLDFSISPSNKEEYFEEIYKAINNEIRLPENIDEAWLAYWFVRNYRIKTFFTEQSEQWMNYTLSEISELENIPEIIDNIVFGIPTILKNVKALSK
jgi:hypothetical protein